MVIKSAVASCEEKLDTLLDAHLEQAISREEYTAKKNKVLSQKMDLDQKMKDFERKGSAWLERARAFVLAAHQAENVALEENLFAKKDFLKKCGSNRLLAGREARIDFKQPWDFVFDLKKNWEFRREDSDTKNFLGEKIFAQNAFFLRDMDSNHDKQIQSLLSCR